MRLEEEMRDAMMGDSAVLEALADMDVLELSEGAETPPYNVKEDR